MTLQGVLDRVDRMKDNLMSQADKIEYINEIEGKFHQEMVMKCAHTEEQAVRPVYDTDTEPSTVLLAPAPYDKMYEYYVMAKIDMMNREVTEENNNMARFDKEYRELCNYWRREHMPITPVEHFYF